MGHCPSGFPKGLSTTVTVCQCLKSADLHPYSSLSSLPEWSDGVCCLPLTFWVLCLCGWVRPDGFNVINMVPQNFQLISDPSPLELHLRATLGLPLTYLFSALKLWSSISESLNNWFLLLICSVFSLPCPSAKGNVAKQVSSHYSSREGFSRW